MEVCQTSRWAERSPGWTSTTLAWEIAENCDGIAITEHDRHVLAFAVHVEADSIVTFNLCDFPVAACEPYGVEAVDPDSFAVAVAESDPSRAHAALSDIARRRTRPPMTVHDLHDRLEVVLANFVSQVREGLPNRA